MNSNLRITRYNKTRYWAIWVAEGLLSVTVYKKGAQAILEYITSHTTRKTMNTKSANCTKNEELTIQAVNNQGVTGRIKIEPIGTSVCHTLRGKWHTDEIYNQSLPELIADGYWAGLIWNQRQISQLFFPKLREPLEVGLNTPG